MLRHCLSPRDRETISGDLLEEYREEQAPRLGSLRANLWYLRQSISFISLRSFDRPPMRAALTFLCLFTAAAGVLLAVMEIVMKHVGYGQRMAIAVCIVTQAVATLLLLVTDVRRTFRALVFVGAAGVGLLGVSAIWRILDSRHFEGFVFLIGSALIAQGCLTLTVGFGQRENPDHPGIADS